MSCGCPPRKPCKHECRIVAKACDHIIEEHESELAEALASENLSQQELAAKVCGEWSSVCSPQKQTASKKSAAGGGGLSTWENHPFELMTKAEQTQAERYEQMERVAATAHAMGPDKLARMEEEQQRKENENQQAEL